jgi:glycosyltransferase involved in cell wall biosynthesis
LKTIHIIGSAGVPACYGGFETIAENLVKNRQGEIHYVVFCSNKIYKIRPPLLYGADLKYLNINPNGISSILYDIISMVKSLKSDCMLILGVSGCLFLPFIKLFYDGKIITNIDGIEWRRRKWSCVAKSILHISEKVAVRYSDVIIGDNEGIVEYIKDEYNKRAALIEYGADQAIKHDSHELEEEYSFYGSRYAVAVCRIEPENNVSIILKAFSLQSLISLVIVGNWNLNNYSRTLFQKYSKAKNMYLLGQEYNINKVNFIRCHSSIYIHGHSAGGTNPSLVEAMHLGLPVFAFDCVYNRATTENKCLYWSDVGELCKLVKDMSFSGIASSMKEIADRRYQWKRIVGEYEALFSN